MWLLFARAPAPDAPDWRGRRWFAAIDAVAWPSATWLVLNGLAGAGGITVALLMALLVISAACRLVTAVFMNHRYHFTTWRGSRVLVWMLAVGFLMKLGLAR